jgi:nitrogen fixation protein NifT
MNLNDRIPSLHKKEELSMPKVMLRKGKVGQLVFYVAKQDLEAEVVSLQFDQADKWGGEIELNDGSKFFVEPLDAPPPIPVTVRATRL